MFIPSFHLNVLPADKLKPDWCLDVVNYCICNTNNMSLLHDKNIAEIEGYSSGIFDLNPFKKMFKSEDKKLKQPFNVNTTTAIGIDYECLALIPEKLRSAEAVSDKIPMEISCKAIDPYAIEKKEDDINLLKNKASVESSLQEIADRMKLPKIELGGTQHSSIEFSESPFGLDLDNPEELDIFKNLLYSLKIESAFETVLAYFNELKKVKLIRSLETKDQLKYGVSVNRFFENKITGLPDAEYVYPGNISVPFSRMPDYSDAPHIIAEASLTPLQLFDKFGDEIGSKDDLDYLINASKDDGGYCACNGGSPNSVPYGNFDVYKVRLKHIEVKTVDWIGISQKKGSRFKSFTTDPEKATERIWAQNTYSFWWLQNTKRVFGIDKLPYSLRTKGNESYQNFSYSPYKSVPRSAVELSIGENKNAQIAYIKMQHTVIKSKPDGYYFDIKPMINALSALKEGDPTWTMDKIFTLAWEQNIWVGNTQGFDNPNEGQFKHVEQIPGGLKASITGYMNIIAAANMNISRITGINQQLTGASANEDGLVGLQKLLINASVNALQYTQEAMQYQYKNGFNKWGTIIQQAIEAGGKTKEAIINIIGAKKVNIIDGLDDVHLHNIGVFVEIKQRAEERQIFMNKLTELELNHVLSATDSFMVNNIANPKDQWAYICVKEQQYKKEQAKIREQGYANQQAMLAKQGENQIATANAQTDGDIKKVYAKAHADAQNAQLAGQLGMRKSQLEGFLKQTLQTDRNKAQTQKNIDTLVAKSNIKQQEALTE